MKGVARFITATNLSLLSQVLPSAISALSLLAKVVSVIKPSIVPPTTVAPT